MGTKEGGVAAPVGGQIFSEILPYLEVNQGNQEEVEVREEVVIPNVTGITVQEAEKILKEEGLELQLNKQFEEIDKSNILIQNQTPQPGIVLYKGNKVYLEC